MADSGVSIPEAHRSKVFEPFFRTPAARKSARPGVGLGLSFVKAAIEELGGSVQVGTSHLGGALIALNVPVAEELDDPEKEESEMANSMKVVVIGGVAAGPKVASKVIRLNPDADVTIIEKGAFLSYAGCGLPYYISGVVREQKELMATPVGTVRDSVFFQKVKNVHVLNQTEALEIDPQGKRVRIVNLLTKEESWIEYDKLMLATGATPVRPPLPGMDLNNVFTLHGLQDAEGIKSLLSETKAHDVVIMGAGLIGVEATEALVEKGCRVTVVEMLPQILSMLDWEVAKLVEQHMESKGARVLTNTRVTAIEGKDCVSGVVTDQGHLHADMVVCAVGVRPNVGLAKNAGLEIGQTRAIKVDEYLRTTDPDIYAAGDCVECTNLITGKPCFIPLGSTANKQGRVAAVNICGGSEKFPGILGSCICKVFDYCVGCTGLTETAARDLGFDVTTAMAPAPDRAHYMPTAKPLLMKLVADSKTRRLLGLQVTGPGDGAKRIDVAAMAIIGGMTVDQVANADLCYAPPYSSAMDNLITAANVARNKLDGYMDGISPMEAHRLRQDGADLTMLDVRSPQECEQVRIPGCVNIPLGALRSRLGELDKDKHVIAFCKISLRGYEAALILKAAGFDKVSVMDGGILMWPYEKVD